jgi:hypothetical protein
LLGVLVTLVWKRRRRSSRVFLVCTAPDPP